MFKCLIRYWRIFPEISFLLVFGEYEGNDEGDDDEEIGNDEEVDKPNNRKVFDIMLDNLNEERDDVDRYKYPNKDGEYRRRNKGQRRYDKNNGIQDENGRRRKKHKTDHKRQPEKSKSTYGNSSK